jgi:hypothetical protein
LHQETRAKVSLELGFSVEARRPTWCMIPRANGNFGQQTDHCFDTTSNVWMDGQHRTAAQFLACAGACRHQLQRCRQGQPCCHERLLSLPTLTTITLSTLWTFRSRLGSGTRIGFSS